MLCAQGAFVSIVEAPGQWSPARLLAALANAEDPGGPTEEWLRELAMQRNCAITGSIATRSGDSACNRMLFATPDALHHYDKRHLFAFAGENRRYTAGDERVIVEYQGWRINLQICYDLRFPAWCRNRDDYDLMLLVANWPAKRVHHWSVLLEARAIENQSWVIGVNRCGSDPRFTYPGGTLIANPFGEVVAEAADGGAEAGHRQVVDVGHRLRVLPLGLELGALVFRELTEPQQELDLLAVLFVVGRGHAQGPHALNVRLHVL